MLFLLFQAKFLLDLKNPLIVRALLLQLQKRTKDRRHYLKTKFFDRAVDKITVGNAAPEAAKIDDSVWANLVKTWASTKKQACVYAHRNCYHINSVTCSSGLSLIFHTFFV